MMDACTCMLHGTISYNIIYDCHGAPWRMERGWRPRARHLKFLAGNHVLIPTHVTMMVHLHVAFGGWTFAIAMPSSSAQHSTFNTSLSTSLSGTLILIPTMRHHLKLFIVNVSLLLCTGFFLPSESSMTPLNNMPNAAQSASEGNPSEIPNAGELERLKEEEARLATMLASVRQQKLSVLRSRPLTVGIVGFGRFGQFVGKTFTKYANVIGTSRSDYTKIASDMGAKYIPLSDLESFVMEDDLDVIVIAVSIVSFEDTVKDLVPHLKRRIEAKGAGSCPLIVDVLSVKEHARKVFLDHLPVECDILCTHPMFGPDSAKHGWQGQTFVYERTRVDKVLIDPSSDRSFRHRSSQQDNSDSESEFIDESGKSHSLHENSEAHIEGMDRMERFLR